MKPEEAKNMSTARRIEEKLSAAFAPGVLTIRDDSDKHKGHGGWREGGETHFHVTIRADAFKGKNRVQVHREIYKVLEEELAEQVHALALDASA